MKSIVSFVAIASLLSGCARPTVFAASPHVVDVFPAIPEIRSDRGVARVTFEAVSDPVSGEASFAWNGVLGVMPTIRVHPGDAIDMTVKNDLRAANGRMNMVNVHFHGLTVSPQAPADEVISTIAMPGGTLHYHLPIPKDHEPGLYWYHPHSHGESYYQVTGGISGAIVVEGMQEHLPALKAMPERILVLRDVANGPGYVDADMPMNGMAHAVQHPTGRIRKSNNTGKACRAEAGLSPTLNRQPLAHIGIQPGEREYFRVVNASAARYFDLSIDGAPLTIVARDGMPLDAYPGTAPTTTVDHYLLPPAARVEFVATGPAHATVLRSACVDTGRTGDADPPVVLADLVDPSSIADLNAEDVPLAEASPIVVVGPLPKNWYSRPLPPAAAHRVVRFTEDDAGFYINGHAFAMTDAPAIVAKSGTVEEWTVENETDEFHDFHIHQVHFVPESVDGVAAYPRIWQDTINVPPRKHTSNGRYVPGRVVLAMDFRDPVVRGTFLFHCHILDHEDQGMMAKIEVK